MCVLFEQYDMNSEEINLYYNRVSFRELNGKVEWNLAAALVFSQ